MQIEVRDEDAEILRDLLREKVLELDKEINRTDSLDFKEKLRQLDRTYGRLLADVSAAMQSTQRFNS